VNTREALHGISGVVETMDNLKRAFVQMNEE
jgi:hypothetical protein